MILISIPILRILLSLVRGRWFIMILLRGKCFIMILHIMLQFSGSSANSGNNLELTVFLVLEFPGTLLLCIS